MSGSPTPSTPPENVSILNQPHLGETSLSFFWWAFGEFSVVGQHSPNDAGQFVCNDNQTACVASALFAVFVINAMKVVMFLVNGKRRQVQRAAKSG